MFLRPSQSCLRSILYYLGKILYLFAFLFLIPAFIALLFKEINPFFDFLIGFSVAFIVSRLFYWLGSEGSLRVGDSLSLVAILWVVAMLLSALPLYLSGHYGSYLDACFEAMSGLTTTGLTLVQDLDHMAYSTNFWRHFIMFIAGQGIVVAGILVFGPAAGTLYNLYVGEGREEKIFPNVVNTAKFIWAASFVYLAVGVFVLALVLFFGSGISFLLAIFHSACLFMAAFDTGGFTPQSQSVLYYHNFLVELVTLYLMIAGTMNFALHFNLWFKDKKEIIKNIETRSLFFTILLCWIIVIYGLMKPPYYLSSFASLFKKGFYHVLSAHSGTGYMTIYAKQLATQWSEAALIGLILAMAFGGSSCSTAGGIKAIRLAIFFKSLALEVKKRALPSSAIVLERFHHFREQILNEEIVWSAFFITLLYLLTYFFGGLIGSLLGYPFLFSFFESVSATANVGLSVGITNPSMPEILKVVYIIQMLAGRLEFISIISVFGLFNAIIRGK